MLKITVRYQTHAELLWFLRLHRGHIFEIHPKLAKPPKTQTNGYLRRDVYLKPNI